MTFLGTVGGDGGTDDGGDDGADIVDGVETCDLNVNKDDSI